MGEPTITITHVATKDAVTTTVTTPWADPITKTWKRVEAGHYQMDTRVGWEDEEDLPEDVREAADQSVSGLCAVLADDC